MIVAASRFFRVDGPFGRIAGLRRRQLDGRPHRLDLRCAQSEPHRKVGLISPDGFASPGLEYGVTSKAPLMLRALPYALPSFGLRKSLAPASRMPT